MQRLVKLNNYKTDLLPLAKEAKETVADNESKLTDYMEMFNFNQIKELTDGDWINHVDEDADILNDILDVFLVNAMRKLSINNEEEFFSVTEIDEQGWIKVIKDITVDITCFDEVKESFIQAEEESKDPYGSRGISKKDFY